MADVQGMLKDPAFNKLDPSSQREALSRLDPAFGKLSDADYKTFREKVSQPKQEAKSELAQLIMAPVRKFNELEKGLVKGAGQTALGIFEGANKTLGGAILERVSPTYKENTEEFDAAARKKLEPSNTMQSIGKTGEQIGEYALPIGEEKLVGGIANKGLQLLSRAAASAVRTGATAAAQSGNAKDAITPGAVAGGTSLVLGAVGPALAKLGPRIQLSTIKPSAFDVKDGFKTETLKEFGIKGNLEQALNQTQDIIAKLKNERNAILAKSTGPTQNAKVDLSSMFNDALKEARKKAGALQYGAQGRDFVKQIENMRDDVYSLLGVQGPNLKAEVSVPVAENLKEHLGTMGAWAHGAADPKSKIAEEIANDLYTRAKTGIEKSLGTQGVDVKSLNAQMQRLIPVRNAMLKRIPVEQRQSIMKVADIAALIPGVLTGNPSHFALEGLHLAQKSLRFGNWLTNNAANIPTGAASRLTGAAAGAVSPKNRLEAPPKEDQQP